VVGVWDLVSWGLWIGWAVAIGSFTVGVIRRALGREGYERLLAGSLAGILVLAFGWGLVQAIYGGAVPGVPYGWVFYAVSGALLVTSSIYLALGRAEGASHLVAALLVVGLGFFAASIASGVNTGPGGQLSVSVYPSDTMIESGKQLVLKVRVDGGSPPYSVTIDWGDGSPPSGGSIQSEGEWSKTYSIPDDKPTASFPVRVTAVDSEGRTGWNTFSITVQNKEWCPLGWPFGFFCGFYRLVSSILPALDVQKLVECPLFPMDEGSPIHKIYTMILGVSMSALGLFLAFNLVWRVAGEEGLLGIADSIKDAVVVVALALLAPYVYNATAQALNTISYSLIGDIDVGWVLTWIFAQLGIAIAIGYFVPFIANYGVFLAITLFLASLTVYVRYILILTLIAASPLLAVSYLHPGLRSMARHAASLLAGLMIAGPIAAVFMVILSKTIPGQNIVFGILYPLIVGTLPTVLGTFGGGAASAIAGAVKTGVAGLIGSVAGKGAQASTTTASPGPTHSGVVKLNTPRTTVATKTPAQAEVAPGVKAITIPVKPGPIITPATIKKAIQEARMKGAVAETLAEAREIGPGITFTLHGPEAYKKHAEELAKEPEIHPKWEAFKAGIKTLGGEAGRRAWTNIKALARDTGEAFKYHVEREFGVRLGSLIKRNTRIVPRGMESVDEWLL
jgi:carbon starvation protein